MFQSQVNEYRFEIDRLTRELQDVKRKYFELRRTAQLTGGSGTGTPGNGTGGNAIRSLTDKDPLLQQQNAFHSSQPKISGGGFNLNATAASAGRNTTA